MCFTAHPDDECGAFGGALMLAHQRGVETSVICLTDGRAASNRGNSRNQDELAGLRRKEFASAFRVLGVTHGEVLDYPDGGLVSEDFAAVTTVLVERIRRFRPHVVLTFGGDGNVNLHPDHTMVSFFATAAFHWAGRSNFAPEQQDYFPTARKSCTTRPPPFWPTRTRRKRGKSRSCRLRWCSS